MEGWLEFKRFQGFALERFTILQISISFERIKYRSSFDASIDEQNSSLEVKLKICINDYYYYYPSREEPTSKRGGGENGSFYPETYSTIIIITIINPR